MTLQTSLYVIEKNDDEIGPNVYQAFSAVLSAHPRIVQVLTCCMTADQKKLQVYTIQISRLTETVCFAARNYE